MFAEDELGQFVVLRLARFRVDGDLRLRKDGGPDPDYLTWFTGMRLFAGQPQENQMYDTIHFIFYTTSRDTMVKFG